MTEEEEGALLENWFMGNELDDACCEEREASTLEEIDIGFDADDEAPWELVLFELDAIVIGFDELVAISCTTLDVPVLVFAALESVALLDSSGEFADVESPHDASNKVPASGRYFKNGMTMRCINALLCVQDRLLSERFSHHAETCDLHHADFHQRKRRTGSKA